MDPMAGSVGRDVHRRDIRGGGAKCDAATIAPSLGVNGPFEVQWLSIGILRPACIKLESAANLGAKAKCVGATNAVQNESWRVVGFAPRFYAPIESGAEVVLEMSRPPPEAVVTILASLPPVRLISPIIGASGELISQPIAAGPTAHVG
jgi:hypothetical protein